MAELLATIDWLILWQGRIRTITIDVDERGRPVRAEIWLTHQDVPLDYLENQIGPERELFTRCAARAHRALRKAAGILEN